MSQENVELVRSAMVAWEQEGVEGFLRSLRPDVKFSPVDDEGPLYGHDGVRRNLDAWFAEWEEFEVEVAEVADVGTRVFVGLRVSASGKRSGVPVTMWLYDVFELQDGLVTSWEEYAEREQALEAAGLSE